MIRAAILDHVRPQVEQLAAELAEKLLACLEARLTEALDAARSALESDLADVPRLDVAVAGNGAADGIQHSGSPAEVNHDPSPRKRAAPTKARGTRPTRSVLPAQDDSPIRVPHNKGKQIVCTVCGEPGHNARRHKSAAPSTAPAAASSPPPRAVRAPTPAPSPSLRADRFAAIEAAARARAAAAVELDA